MTTKFASPLPGDEMAHADAATFEARTYAKVARRLIPFLMICYLGAYLDRVNVGFAKLQMLNDLRFSETVYGLGAGIFFLGYFLFEVPSNLLLARIGARVWIARIMITWGLISAAMAFIETPGQFYVLRFLLGAVEAGFFPGVIYYLSQWFPAAQRATAIARFMTATAIAGVIGGPLSGVLLGLDGVAGLAGWQWIFVAEGLPSVALGVVVLFYLTDSPREAEWLSVEERTRLTARLSAEADEIAARGTTSVRAALLHPLVWRLAALYFSLIVGFYSVSFWLPQIVQSLSTLGIVEVATVSAIPYVAAAIAMTIVGRRSDRVGERCRHIAVAALVGAVALAGAGAIESPVAAIVVLVAFTQFLEPILRTVLALTSWGKSIGKFLPGSAGEAITGGSFYTASGLGQLLSHWWAGLLVLLGYAVVFAVLGRLTTLRRDVA